MSDIEDWNRWAEEREAKRSAAPKPKHPVDAYVRLIQRAIRDAEKDGYIVDFEWTGWGVSDMRLQIVHSSDRWQNAITVHSEGK
jgi:hypothetical protein